MDAAAGDALQSKEAPPSKAGRAPRKTKITTNPDKNPEIIDAPDALRASPDSDINEKIAPDAVKKEESPLSDVPAAEPPKKKAKGGKKKATEKSTEANGVDAGTPKKTPAKTNAKTADEDAFRDPEADGDEEADEEEVKEALSRPPPVHSSYLPLPWKGRIGYACLNTYLRYSTPPVFCSRTCRIASILEHRHPLQDPSQPEHATKNRPDRNKPADEALGKKYVEDICLANVRDIAKMIRWNDKYGIKFLRLSSEMFPFASHEEYGYKLAPFASEALAEAGKVIGELGHRVTTHPGQFTQLGSPRQSVIDNAFRDLEYHDELLSLLKLPEQQNKDAVMIIHMGGVFGDKPAALDRFRENYQKLSQSVKNRLVLENDDVSYNLHEILPMCEELNIPCVLDFHHHNILFDETQIREGTKDVMDLYPRILATWQRKGITPKMHYSEPTPEAITPRQRRKHNPRVYSLPPCPDNMDLMIEAKDKEQAVFELMRNFKLPGWDTFNDVIPYQRSDDNKLAAQEMSKVERKRASAKAKREKKGLSAEDDDLEGDESLASITESLVREEDVGMGGPQNRVYWPPGMEDYLRPKKREVKKKEPVDPKAPVTVAMKKAQKAAAAAAAAADADAEGGTVKEEDEESDVNATPATKKAKAMLKKRDAAKASVLAKSAAASDIAVKKETKAKAPKAKTVSKKKEKEVKAVPTPSTSADEDEEEELELGSEEDEDPVTPVRPSVQRNASRKSARSKGRVSYNVDGEEDVDMAED